TTLDDSMFDPCNSYAVLDEQWRSTKAQYKGHDDTLVEWSGWYRLYLQGASAQLPEWCVKLLTCGGYTPLSLDGSHPQPEDGIVTRGISGSLYGRCGAYRSKPIQVKACPGNYYVYKLVKPDISIPMPSYCAVAVNHFNYDPCDNYTALDQPWRANNGSRLQICDNYFNWNGWYRLFYHGMNIRMTESCVAMGYCGTAFPMSLSGPHPQIEDGVVTRQICGTVGYDCCYLKTTTIQVKACPGDYYVYELVKPDNYFCDVAYCTDVGTITPALAPTTAMTYEHLNTGMATTSDDNFDPCYNYTALEDDWRSIYNTYSGYDDTTVEWDGWYRLYLEGRNAQISVGCVSYKTCGGYSPLALDGAHPQEQDGIVTRNINGFSGSNCNSVSRSNPIQVKACPGHYYVYRLVKPDVSIPMPTYCTGRVLPVLLAVLVAFNYPSTDPCNDYSVLDHPFRASNSSTRDLYPYYWWWYHANVCDSYTSWNGWYRLLHHGNSIRMPESCVRMRMCATDVTLWLNDPHPRLEDGVVFRRVCGSWDEITSKEITPPVTTAAQMPHYYSVHYYSVHSYEDSSDPCNSYSVLDDDWRNTQSYITFLTHNRGHDDTAAEWKGWYRLYLKGQSAQIPEWVVSYMECGGYTPLWLSGSHPQVQDGIVTREIYGVDNRDFKAYKSHPIQVKACPGLYYVYKLLRPPSSIPAPSYCAAAFINPSSDPCYNYNSLEDTWRATDIGASGWRDDLYTSWSGWYRLLYQGNDIRMPETCVSPVRCGALRPLWLNGPHPRLKDGVVIRQLTVQMLTASVQSTLLISQKQQHLQSPWTSINLYHTDYYPCNNYTPLDQLWRATNESLTYVSDTDFKWNGWYRLFYNGMNIRMPESCVPASRCSTGSTLWINGSHPQIEDGVVTRQVCGNDGRDCCNYRPRPIRIRACPGNYYVYEFVNPSSSSDQSYVTAYCAGNLSYINTITPTSATTTADPASTPTEDSSDPCYSYTVLDDDWRNTQSYITFLTHNRGHDDTAAEWKGWYRLYLKGQSAQIPEWVVSYMECGGYTPLWLSGSHPQVQDGIVTRAIYGVDNRDFKAYKSHPIQVKACPGLYYVYKLLRPPSSIPAPSYCAAAFINPSSDPCYNYNSLEDTWRATDIGASGWRNDLYTSWSGWYRLLYQGNDIRMPETCVSPVRCGALRPLWLNGPHPRLKDGVVIRQVCVSWNNDCCYFISSPIQVKACPGNYYVYEFVTPVVSSTAYCSDVNSIGAINTADIPETTASTESMNMPTITTISLLSPPPSLAMVDPCVEQECTEEEWCGERDGVYGCFCNPSHPAPRDESYDSRETCESSSGTMSLSRCQLFEAGFPTNVLHLSDPSCHATLQNGRLVFHFDNDEHICGTNLTANSTHFIYENLIRGGADSTGGPISRKKRLELRFSCVYQLSQKLTMDTEFNPLQSIVHKNLPDGQGLYQIRIIPYQDAAFSHPYNGKVDIEVDQRIYVEVTVQGVDGRQIATVIDSCWATPVNDQNYAVRWDLIINKCPNPEDDTVDILQNGVSTNSRFSFRMFTFSDNYSKVFLHCAIHLCLLQNNNCAAKLWNVFSLLLMCINE
ncbi:hypothetical protein NFI96_017007, partial [Prochilodus magdalenae]